MDFSVLFRLRTKKLWWVDVLFYFAISVFIATILCYFIFVTKNYFQRQDIQAKVDALQEVGTEEQKQHEEVVLDYEQRIADFSELFKNHEFATNVFAFLQMQTMPNIWFREFNMNRKSASVGLSGEADSMDILGKQMLSLEKNEYIRNLGNLTSTLGTSSRVQFDVALSLDPKIFTYVSDMAAVWKAQEEAAAAAVKESTEVKEGGAEEAGAAKSSEKLITSFHAILDTEVIGIIDQENYTVMLDVPFGTDITNLKISVETSPNATVLPATGAVQNFTDPQTYTVTAEDGTTQDYKITVNVLPEQKAEEQAKPNTVLIVLLSVITVLIIVLVVLFAWLRVRKKKMNNINANKDTKV